MCPFATQSADALLQRQQTFVDFRSFHPYLAGGGIARVFAALVARQID